DVTAIRVHLADGSEKPIAEALRRTPEQLAKAAVVRNRRRVILDISVLRARGAAHQRRYAALARRMAVGFQTPRPVRVGRPRERRPSRRVRASGRAGPSDLAGDEPEPPRPSL